LLLARHGAKVVVNDIGPAAGAVVAEIEAMGGEALAAIGSVTDEAQVGAMVEEAKGRWGRIDILVNNAGILRDASFAKMTIADFRSVVDVHLMGAVICTKAVWDTMRTQNYGRIVMTTSSSGLYGNFGQSNYGAAKMALVGLMQTLSIVVARAHEGASGSGARQPRVAPARGRGRPDPCDSVRGCRPFRTRLCHHDKRCLCRSWRRRFRTNHRPMGGDQRPQQ
jgi:NAD(P)-dependent dehydrogenase (short-subunit alcohol dehydrogenase family)